MARPNLGPERRALMLRVRRASEQSALRSGRVPYHSGEWKPCPGYETTHEVSDMGQVRRSATGKMLSVQRTVNGASVNMGPATKCRQRLIHRLVIAALRQPSGRWWVRFENDDRYDCRLSNMSVLTKCPTKEPTERSTNPKAYYRLKSKEYKARKLAASPTMRARIALRKSGIRPMLTSLIRDLRVTHNTFAFPPMTAQEKRAKKKADKLKRRSLKAGALTGPNRIAYVAFVRSIQTDTAMPCYWCQKPTRRGQRHIDHIQPISKGGKDDVHNLCCSCPRCNMKKHDKDAHVFCGQYQLNLAA